MKQALVMMDLSGLGRCALGVAISTLSAMGIQPVPLPTGAFSTHTGGFGSVARQDLTEFVQSALAHYARLQRQFAAVYAGYLLSDAQIELLAELLRAHPSAFRLVDPVMGDHGSFYGSIGPSRAEAYRQILPLADLITPNHTEAHLLLDVKKPIPFQALLNGLLMRGANAALIKGVPMSGGGFANVYQSQRGDPLVLPYVPAPGAYPGTGDLFASVLLGCLLQDQPPQRAMKRAADFVGEAILHTNALGTDPREGVAFEPILGRLC